MKLPINTKEELTIADLLQIAISLVSLIVAIALHD